MYLIGDRLVADPTFFSEGESYAGLLGFCKCILHVEQVHLRKVPCGIETTLLMESMANGTFQEIVETSA